MPNKKLGSPRDSENLVYACQNQKLCRFLWNITDTSEMLSLVTNQLRVTDYGLAIKLRTHLVYITFRFYNV